MPRLIDADELIELLELLAKHEDPFRQSVILGVVETIRSRPTIDPESLRLNGRWEKATLNGYLRCSECKDVYIYEDWLADGKWRFCPNCGAKMEEADER